MKRTPTKKWIVDNVIITAFGEMVPLFVDPTDGQFWFEFPEGSGNQYAGRDRGVMTAGIHEVVAAHHSPAWTQHIAVKEVAPYDRTAKPDPPYVGFSELFRFERSVVELRVPKLYRGSKHQIARSFRQCQEDPVDNDWRWHTVRSETLRLFPSDDEPLYIGNSRSMSTSGCTVLDYSHELWDRFIVIHETCVLMHRQLKTLMAGTPSDVVERIMALEGGPRLITKEGG